LGRRMGTLKPHHARHITGMTVPHASQCTPKPVLPVFLSVICTLRHGAPQEQPLPTSSSMMRASRPAHDEAVSLPVSRYTVFAIRSACITIASRISPAPHGHAYDAAPARWAVLQSHPQLHFGQPPLRHLDVLWINLDAHRLPAETFGNE